MSITPRSTPPTPSSRILDAADDLFAEHGIIAVSVQGIAAKAGVTLEELGSSFDSKDQIVEAVLDSRHANWMTRLTRSLEEYVKPEDKLLSIFTFLEHWFAEESFHRCAFVTSYGELGPSAGWVADMVRRHRDAFDTLVGDLAENAALPSTVLSSIALLADGAQVTAAAMGRISAARDARTSAAMLIAVYRSEPDDIAFE